MKKNEDIKFLFIGFCLFIIVYFFSFNIPAKISSAFNDFFYWYNYTFAKKSIKPIKLIGIVIDDNSLNKIPERWPWRRTTYAQLIKVLDEQGARVIGFDVVFKGESDIKEDDEILTETLKTLKSKVVLACQKSPILLPFQPFRDACLSMGMVDTFPDKDGKVRRIPVLTKFKGNPLYSFSIQLSAAFVGQSQEKIVSLLPLLKDKTLLLNYLLLPKDIIKLSFYDVLENLSTLKQRYGENFLNDSLVLVYPEAEIIHDIHPTPLGSLPGGILHLNAVADIISGRMVRQIDSLSLPFFVLSFITVFYILKNCGFISGILFTLGVLVFNFWCLVFLGLKGIKYDYAQIAVFSLLFFLGMSLYKYIWFLSQLLKIKDKAVLDPLRNIFTLRYFYYRLELEFKKRYLRKRLFLVFIELGAFREAVNELSLEKQKKLWQEIAGIFLKESFWSLYSAQELIGCVYSLPDKAGPLVCSLKNNLGAILKDYEFMPKIKLGYLKLKKEYPIKELLFILSNELKKKQEDIVLFGEGELLAQLGSVKLNIQQQRRFLDGLDEDIEDRNRELLGLLENLSKEHARVKEAAFEVIASLANCLEARDPYTQGHSQRVANYAKIVAEKLDWNNEEKEKLQKACLLHDIGKIGIPDRILHKPEALNNEEFDFIKKHELISIRILEPLKDIKDILPWIVHHHERWDGKGYPHGLGGNTIPLASRVISLTDVFDALTSGRDYKKALSLEEAIEEISKNKGSQFDPQLTDVFIEAIKATRR